MEVDNSDESYIPGGPIDTKTVPVSLQKMEVDISSAKVQMESRKATVKNDELELEMDRFIPGIADDAPVNVGSGNLDPQSVKAKLRQKIQRKSAEFKLLQDAWREP